tara:strand:+ start:18816 stop:19220 length:405 start_codon:yes stop_codon:yes gene_type:complete
MRIKELASNDWKICSPIVSDDDFTDIEIYINANQADKSLTNAMAAIDRLSKFGSRGFTDSSVHEVNKEHGIYQLRKGNHRFLYFHGEERKLIVMACPHRKSGNKVDPKQVKLVVQIKLAYNQSNDDGSIIYCKD